MNLQEIRQHVVELSGRYDLVDTLYGGTYFPDQTAVPVNVDFFINAGLEMLDNAITVPELEGELQYALTAGTYLVTLPNIRSVQSVWISDAEGATYLVSSTPEDIVDEYGVSPFSAVDQGRPLFYTTSHQRELNEASSDTTGLSRFIYVLPVPDADYTLHVRGIFGSGKLVEANDVNWWTHNHAFLVVNAALYKMEVVYRNTAGAKDYLFEIERQLRDLEANGIEGDIANITYMRNSW